MAKFDILAKVGSLLRSERGTSQQPRLTEWGSLAVAQVEDPCTEAARQGRRFVGGLQIVANAVASVTAIPTTTATISLYNGDVQGGRSLFIDRIGFVQTNQFASSSMSLYMALSGAKIVSPPTANPTGWSIGSTNGLGASKALFQSGATFASSTVWVQAASITLPVPSATAANHQFLGHTPTRIEGGLVVPPGYSVGFALVNQVTSISWGLYLHWNEFESILDAA